MAPINSKSGPSDQTLESLSSLIDGQTKAFESRRLLDMVYDSALSEKWQRYHLIGALMRKELSDVPLCDLSQSISATIAQEPSLAGGSNGKAVQGQSTSSRNQGWRDLMGKSALAASVAVAVLVGVQFSKNGSFSPLDSGNAAAQLANVQEPVVAAPLGFDIPAPAARNVSLGGGLGVSLTESQRSIQAAVPTNQQFLSNAEVEAELQQLFLQHAELSSENGRFGLMPMARAAKMTPAN
jgi:sigma-E factor negative regulatory protein RseA